MARRLLERFRHGGVADAIASWIGTGPNAAISPAELHRVLGRNTADPSWSTERLANGRLPNGAELLPGPR